MPDKLINQQGMQPLEAVELRHTEGGFSRDQLIHILPIRFPRLPLPFPIAGPGPIPLEQPIRMYPMVLDAII